MIVSINIKNFILIKDIEILFAPGLNILTGITGGGKSLILKALDFLLGARASKEVIYPGCDSAEVSAVFRASIAVRRIAESELGITVSADDTLILRRIYRTDKTNLCYINGAPVLVGNLQQVGERVVDYLGQNHQLRLQQNSEQLAVLDGFSGADKQVRELGKLLEEMRNKEQGLRKAEDSRNSSLSRLEQLRNDLEYLQALAPKQGEDETLKQNIAVHEHLSSLLEAFNRGVDYLYEGEISAIDEIHSIKKVIERIDDIPKDLQDIGEDTDAVSEMITQLVHKLQRYSENAEFSKESLEEMEKRYYALQEAKNRFNREISELLEYIEYLPESIKEYEHVTLCTDELTKEIGLLWEKVCSFGRKINEKRRRAKGKFEDSLKKELFSLGMEGCQFFLNIKTREFTRENVMKSGFNRINFMFSANPGIEAKSLKDIASGGELSRIMLGIQAVTGVSEDNPTFIFDEIDSEIGGRMGMIIGKKMKALSSEQQVICITHLPQIASFGDEHFKIDKSVIDGKTVVDLLHLHEESRIKELAHMVGGDSHEEESTFNEVKLMLERARND